MICLLSETLISYVQAKNHSFLIYHSQLCGQCRDVLELLDSKYPSLKYDYYEWQAQPGGLFLMNAVLKKTGTSVPPEIYICKEYIGGKHFDLTDLLYD